jgi:hypothetical protein
MLHTQYNTNKNSTPCFSIGGTKQYIYYCSDICTSSSLPPGGGAEPDAEADAAAVAGGGVSLGCIVWRYTSIGVPSRIRKSTGVLGPSCTPHGPRMPIEVLFVVSSLSCCNVSRSACSPWRIRSSRLPVRHHNSKGGIYSRVRA